MLSNQFSISYIHKNELIWMYVCLEITRQTIRFQNLYILRHFILLLVGINMYLKILPSGGLFETFALKSVFNAAREYKKQKIKLYKWYNLACEILYVIKLFFWIYVLACIFSYFIHSFMYIQKIKEYHIFIVHIFILRIIFIAY